MLRDASSFFKVPRRAVAQRRPCLSCSRALHDGRNRISNFWTPTGGVSDRYKIKESDSTYLLYRAGFLRAAYTGIYQLLPLGLRVQEKLERLIDKHMRSLGASKVSLSSLSSYQLWEKSGRLKSPSDVFKFNDRKGSKFLLAPTHEEEITTIAASLVQSYKDLPLRLYQISRKYRDERRPREGLLRGREFLMKDLYTFDYSIPQALETYDAVREVYSSFFRDLKIPFLVAEADSGNMGGNLSHEYHIPSEKGEDLVISCSSCDYVANEELAESGLRSDSPEPSPSSSNASLVEFGLRSHASINLKVWRGLTEDGLTLVSVHYPSRSETDKRFMTPLPTGDRTEINLHLLRSMVPDIDLAKLGTASSESVKRAATKKGIELNSLKEINIFDYRVPRAYRERFPSFEGEVHPKVQNWASHPITGQALNMQRIQDGDPCPRCDTGTLKSTTAIELGHTFFLGTRYSSIFDATVAVDPGLLPPPSESASDQHTEQHVEIRKTDGRTSRPSTSTTAVVPLQMGCHGIGVSRMIAAVADHLADSKGLNWPRLIAPFEVIVIPGLSQQSKAEEIYDELTAPTPDATIDAILDDRDKDMPWKLSDADLIGYPVIVVLGNSWKKNGTCEVQCRRLGLKEFVDPKDLKERVESLLKKL